MLDDNNKEKKTLLTKMSVLKLFGQCNGLQNLEKLDKNIFSKTISCLLLSVEAQKLNQSLMKMINPLILKIRRSNEILPNFEAQKTIAFDPTIINSYQDLDEITKNTLQSNNISEANFFKQNINISYDNWSQSEKLNYILPENVSISSFTNVGHIIQLNLREDSYPYRFLIGTILLDENKSIRTVITKLESINSEYRNFSYEILAGDDDLVTTLNHNGCKLSFDFSKVYWNSRLCTEHTNVVQKIQFYDYVFDVFAGVGPFAIPAFKKGAIVFANDLNPEAYKWLEYNAMNNSSKTEGTIKCYNLDGADFISNIIKCQIEKIKASTKPDSTRIFIVMNLPEKAYQFLGALYEIVNDFNQDIKIYCYCFDKDKNERNEKEAINIFGMDKITSIESRLVRAVSTNKKMFCMEIMLNHRLEED